MTYGDAFAIAVDFFRKLAKVAESLNIVFCIEPTPIMYGADFITNTNEAITLINAVNHNAFKLNLDIGSSILNNEKIEIIIRKNIKEIGHIHISEPYLKIINQKKCFHDSISESLRKEKYKGFISIEMKSSSDIDTTKIAETLSFVKSIYNF